MCVLIKDVTVDALSKVLDDAFFGYKVDDDGDIYVTDGVEYPIWISLIQDYSALRIFTFANFCDEKNLDELSALRLANEINRVYLPNSVSVRDGKLWSTYVELLDCGISKGKFVTLLRRCSSSFAAAVRAQGRGALVA